MASGGGSAASKWNFDVGRHGVVALADAGDVSHVLVSVGDGRGALHRQEVAEPERRKPGNELDPENVTLLDFDVETRRGENVVRGEAEVVEVADTDAWNDVAVRRKSDRTSRGGHVQRVGAGGIGRSGGDEHHNRGTSIVRDDHPPDGRLRPSDVGQPVPVAVALEEVGAGEKPPPTGVHQQRSADGVRERLLRLGAVGTEALALTGRRRTHGVVESRAGVNHLLNDKVSSQLEQAIGRADEHLQSQI